MMPGASELPLASNPDGLCECGCGEPSPIASKTNRALGHIKGQPVRFINGHRSRLNRVSAPVEDKIVAMVAGGASTGAAAKAHGVHIQTVRAILRRRRRSDLIQPFRRYPTDPDVFRRLTPASAYWLGFLMADGSRGNDHTLKLSLRLGDEAHVAEFVRFLGCPERPLRQGDDGRGNRTIAVHLRSAAVSSELERWGIVRRKSLDGCRAHPELAVSGAFWRGMLDGDGTVSFDRFGAPRVTLYNSSLALLEQYAAFIRAHVDGPSPRPLANRTIWAVTLHGTRGRAALEAIQAALDPGLGLARKNPLVERALAWRSQQEVRAARDTRMAARYAAGDVVREIARAEGVRRGTVLAAARRAGIEIRPSGGPRRTPTHVHERALRAYAAGEPMVAVAAEAGVHVGTLAYWCRRDGLPPRGPGGAFPPAARRRAQQRVDELFGPSR
jgi:transposase-like protein